MASGIRSLAPRAALLLAALALGGCNDDGGGSPPLPEPELAKMRITISGLQIVDVSSTGVVTGGPIGLNANLAAVTVEFLEADGGAALLVPEGAFRVEAVSGDEAIFTIARTGDFAFNFTSANVNDATTLSLELVHLGPDHADFGPFDVPVEVNAGGNQN